MLKPHPANTVPSSALAPATEILPFPPLNCAESLRADKVPLYYKFYLAFNRRFSLARMLSYSLVRLWEVIRAKSGERRCEDLARVTQLLKGLACYPFHPFSFVSFHTPQTPQA